MRSLEADLVQLEKQNRKKGLYITPIGHGENKLINFTEVYKSLKRLSPWLINEKVKFLMGQIRSTII